MRSVAFAAGLAFGLTTASASDYDLKLKDVVDHIAEYDITHVVVPPIPSKEGVYLLMGTTDCDRKKININPIYNKDIRREAVIHELYHAQLCDRGVQNQSEIQVGVLAKEKFKEVYGKEFVFDTKDPFERRYK